MSGQSYAKFVKILEKWPLDPNKKGKDVGQALRQLFSHNYPLGSTSVVNEKEMNKQILALESLVSNKNSVTFPRQSNANFTLLDKETLSGITSTELMGQMSEENKPGLLQRIKNIRFLR